MRTLTMSLLLIGVGAWAGDAQVETIAPKAAAALVDKGAATLVDVREEEEVTSGMAKPAKWFPLSRVHSDPPAFKTFLAGLPKAKVVFYCAAGGRSATAGEKAKALGYSVANMGGFSDWTAEGLPTRNKP